MDNFDRIARGDTVLAVLRSRNDFPIDLDGDRSVGQPEISDEVSKSKTLGDVSHSAVYRHLHRRTSTVTRSTSHGACGRAFALRRYALMESSGGAATRVPSRKKEDTADVARALDMANAMYEHGDRAGALRWLQRAAESASEAQADTRALELAKAAADLASANRQANADPSASPASVSLGTTAGARRTPPGPQNSVAKRIDPPPRFGLGLASPHGRPSMRTAPDSGVNNPRADKPPSVGAFPDGSAVAPDPPSSRPALVPRPPPIWSSNAPQSNDAADEKTRVRPARFRSGPEPPHDRPIRERLDNDGGLQVAQAIRVVLWRGPDGVHVAPRGTRVGPLAVEAVLVGVDSGTDLFALFHGK